MKTILYFLIILFASPAFSQNEWKFEREEEGIKGYTREVEGSKFDEFLIETTLDASMSQVLALFKDFEVYTDVFPGTEEVKVFLDEPDHHITYIKFDIPFPARDRDAVFDNYIKYNKEQGILSIDVQCLDKGYETNPKLVLIPFCEGGWEFTQLPNNQLAVKHNLLLNPGGAAPAFIVNAKAVDDPIKTLKSIKKKIQDPKYKGRSFDILTP